MNCLVITTLAGPNATHFLQGYVTNDTDEVSNEFAKPTAFTDIKGRVIANGWMYGGHNAVNIVVHASTVSIVHEHLAKYLIFAKAKFDENIQRVDLTETSAASVSLTPFDWFLTDAIPPDPQFQSMVVEQGFGLVTAATSGKFLPQMLGLTDIDAVSFAKGCYLGQEVVARVEHRGQVKRRLLRYRWEGRSLEVEIQSLRRAVLKARL